MAISRDDLAQDVFIAHLENPNATEAEKSKLAKRVKFRHEKEARLAKQRSLPLCDPITTSQVQDVVFLLDLLEVDEEDIVRRVLFEEQTYREIAAESGVSHETARRRFLRAIAKLNILANTTR